MKRIFAIQIDIDGDWTLIERQGKGRYPRLFTSQEQVLVFIHADAVCRRNLPCDLIVHYADGSVKFIQEYRKQ